MNRARLLPMFLLVIATAITTAYATVTYSQTAGAAPAPGAAQGGGGAAGKPQAQLTYDFNHRGLEAGIRWPLP